MNFRLQALLENFDNKSYRNYFFAVMLSLTGVGFFLYTQGWYVLHLTGSKLSVGLSWSIFFAPGLFFLPIMGKLLDVAPIKKTLVILEFTKAGILLIFIPVLYFFPSVYFVYMMSALFGIFFSVFLPSIFVVLKKIIAEKDLAKYSHLLELSLQIGSSASIYCSGCLYKTVGFLFLVGMGGLLMLLAGFVMMNVIIINSSIYTQFNLLAEYKNFFTSINELIRKKTLSKKTYLFGLLHQFPQNIVLALNIPLLLYVYEIMQKGPVQYGILDSLIGISAMFIGLFWTKHYLKGQEKSLVVAMPLFSALTFAAIFFISPIGIFAYGIFCIVAIFLTSSKVQCRAAVLKNTPNDIIGQLTAFYQVGNYIIMIILAFTFSYLCQHLPINEIFLIIGALMLSFSLFLTWAYTGDQNGS
jgi:MFS family permease